MIPSLSLHRRYAGLETRLPVVGLLRGPTPVERLPSLESGGVSVWMKRDDRSAEPYGGNKPRKLDFILADAKIRGVTTLLTVGGLGSNHALATTIHGKAHGFRVRLALYPQPISQRVLKNLRLSCHLADEILRGESYDRLDHQVRGFLAADPSSDYIPAGGSTVIGALGFVNAGLELADQVASGELPEPRRIVLAAGTCATLAGLMVGLKLAGLSTRVIGIRVVDRRVTNPDTVMTLATGCLERLRLASPAVPVVSLSRGDFDLIDDHYGAGYGLPTVAGDAAAERVSPLTTAQFESTYTAKALAGFLDQIRIADGPALFWHTYAGNRLDALADRLPMSVIPPELAGLLEQAA